MNPQIAAWREHGVRQGDEWAPGREVRRKATESISLKKSYTNKLQKIRKTLKVAHKDTCSKNTYMYFCSQKKITRKRYVILFKDIRWCDRVPVP